MSPKGAIFQNIWASLVRKYFANIFQNNPIGLEISGAHDMQQPKKSIGKLSSKCFEKIYIQLNVSLTF